jgi:glycosyltransferase involved in cell wall biosynthesis
MAKRYDFVIVSQQSWDTQIGSNIKDIALEIAVNNRVLFINRALDFKTLLFHSDSSNAYISKRLKARKSKNTIEQIQKNLFVLTPKSILASINQLPDGKIFDFFNKRNNLLISREIKKAVQDLDLQNIILINDGELFNGLYLPETLNPLKSLYYYRDNFLAVPFWQKHGTRLEPKLFANYDSVVCNSVYLKQKAQDFNPRSYYVGQGCDFSSYDTVETRDTQNPQPIVGYVGALNSLRLDIKLLESLTTNNPQWKWKFVGPEDEKFQSSKMHELDNVVFYGAKKPSELGEYIQEFDVAINPQLKNEVTIGNYPRKIDEYLYMGKPTVATDTMAMQMFAEHCYLATDRDSYEQSIKQALKENSRAKEQKRKAFAMTHSWTNSVNAIYETIEKI